MSEQKEPKQVQMIIKDGINLFADETTVMSNPLKITFDFKNISPRFDTRNNEFQPIVVEHTVVTMEPWQAKDFLNTLKGHMDNFEKQFGEVKRPESIVKFEELMKNAPIVSNERVQTYFG
jgi:hypothetical protein